MRDVLAQILEAELPALSSCLTCPVKGGCVFVTPAYEPGYCLHEYKLLHAYLASRLREHPPAGASDYDRLLVEARSFGAKIARERPFDVGALHNVLPYTGGLSDFFHGRQLTLGAFAHVVA